MDNLDENYLIDDKFSHTFNESHDEELSESELLTDGQQESSVIKKKRKTSEANESISLETSSSKSKKRRRKKNITEILKLRENSIIKPSQPIKEFKNALLKYMNENLSSVEKNELNLHADNLDCLRKMILKRNKTHKLSVEKQFERKFEKKLNQYLENKEKSSKKREPYVLILCSSALRCIELQKLLSDKIEAIKTKKLLWIHAFAKHKKLSEQIGFLQNLKNPTHIVFSTPHRFMQLIQSEPKGLLLNQLKYVFIDYTHKDVKKKGFFDKPEIKNDFLKLFFSNLLKIKKLKLYLA